MEAACMKRLSSGPWIRIHKRQIQINYNQSSVQCGDKRSIENVQHSLLLWIYYEHGIVVIVFMVGFMVSIICEVGRVLIDLFSIGIHPLNHCGSQ